MKAVVKKMIDAEILVLANLSQMPESIKKGDEIIFWNLLTEKWCKHKIDRVYLEFHENGSFEKVQIWV